MIQAMLRGALTLPTCFGLLALACTPMSVSAEVSELRRSAIVRAVEQAGPSVVNIRGQKTVTEVVEATHATQTRRVNGMGTGVVIDERGYIITNYHVVEGVARIEVTTNNGEQHMARLIAHDAVSDLAVIKIPTTVAMPVVNLGTSSDLLVGETVIAMGNAFGYENTITTGIISALHRSVQVSDTQDYSDLIQTDASINPGNSGGPLMNIDGQVIGINVAVRVGAQGIGFTIPIDRALEIAARLMTTERIDGVWHGIEGETVFQDDRSYLLIQSVTEGSPAALAGVNEGDLLLGVGGHAVQRTLDLERHLLGSAPGDRAEFVVSSEGEERTLQVNLMARSEPVRGEIDRAWSMLGLRLAPIDQDRFRQYQTNYRGGLQVLGVRSGSPAEQQGIRRGDVLVGMHVWETITLDNVRYVLDHPQFREFAPIKFYIVRGQETLYGHLPVTLR